MEFGVLGFRVFCFGLRGRVSGLRSRGWGVGSVRDVWVSGSCWLSAMGLCPRDVEWRSGSGSEGGWFVIAGSKRGVPVLGYTI